MMLFDAGLPAKVVVPLGIGIIIFFLLIFGTIAFIAYKILKRK